MLSVSSVHYRYLRILFTVFTLSFMTGCVTEEDVSLTRVVNTTDNSGGNDGQATSNTTDNGGSNDEQVTSTGSFSLSWTAPATRQDGSPISLAEINGYKVYYGSNPDDFPTSVDIDDGSATSATVSDVPVGDYYIVMTTYDSAGRESPQSGVVTKQAL